jgi:hypothetical protein
MGSRWQVDIGKRAAPVFGKNFVSDQLMLVFTDTDRFLDHAKRDDLAEFDRLRADDPEFAMDAPPRSWHTRLLGYSTTAGALRSRLELQGFSSERVHALSIAFFDDELTHSTEYAGIDQRDSWPQGQSSYPDGAAVTAALASLRGQATATAPAPSLTDPEQRFLHDQWVSLRESFDDPRFALSLALTSTRAATMVTLDLTDLVLGGWMTTDDLPHQDARTRMAAAVAASGPVIVIAEGASDARWLRRSLEIATPAAAHLFEFLDFAEYRAPGGTDRVVSLTKGMAAAGVMNRIVAVLDNDTAGRLAADQLADLAFPARITVINLPKVAYATQYPTLGPEGSATANVNGRAASIEFMFGDDILRDADGTLFPVRWQSFIVAACEYQGRLEANHKTRVGERIDQALADAGDSAMSEQVLDGCRRLASMLLAAADPPPHVPASEFSDLTGTWRSSQAR